MTLLFAIDNHLDVDLFPVLKLLLSPHSQPCLLLMIPPRFAFDTQMLMNLLLQPLLVSNLLAPLPSNHQQANDCLMITLLIRLNPLLLKFTLSAMLALSMASSRMF